MSKLIRLADYISKTYIKKQSNSIFSLRVFEDIGRIASAIASRVEKDYPELSTEEKYKITLAILKDRLP
ncbi:MAG: hypothetical protein WC942_08990 [Clostridia bacterium]|jgi:hypothetical protein